MKELVRGLVVAAALLIAGRARACQTSTVILDESFQAITATSGWSPASDYTSYGATGAILKPPAGRSIITSNQNFTSDGSDICATWLFPPPPAAPTLSAGVAFWFKDFDNYYVASLNVLGGIGIYRTIAGTPHTILHKDAKDVGAANLTAGSKNEIEVEISGTRGAMLINGKKVADFGGQPPPGTGLVGIYADSPGTAPAVFSTFPKFQVGTYP